MLNKHEYILKRDKAVCIKCIFHILISDLSINATNIKQMPAYVIASGTSKLDGNWQLYDNITIYLLKILFVSFDFNKM